MQGPRPQQILRRTNSKSKGKAIKGLFREIITDFNFLFVYLKVDIWLKNKKYKNDYSQSFLFLQQLSLFEVLVDFIPEKAIMLRLFLYLFLPFRPCELAVYTYHVFKVFKGEYSGSFIQNKLR